MCNEIKGSYDKIIITIVLTYTGKNITRLLPLALLLVLHTLNNTDGTKIVIFSAIALYYGDTCMVISKTQNGTSGTNGMPGKNLRTGRRVTANVCILTGCSTHTVHYNLQKSSMGSQESCL